MKAALSMWTNTRMIVLTAVVAAIYAAAQIVLNPFEIVLIPSVVSFRPSNILTMVLGVFFGPAGAWGVGFGNLIGDFFTGSLALGSGFGFLSAFSVAFIGYTFWTWLHNQNGRGDAGIGGTKQWLLYIGTGLVAAAASGVVLGWGLNLLGIAPFQLISNVLTANFSIGNVLGVILYRLLYGRFKAMHATWTDNMAPSEIGRPRNAWLGALLIVIGSIGGWVLGAFLLQGTAITPVVGIFFLLILLGAVLL